MVPELAREAHFRLWTLGYMFSDCGRRWAHPEEMQTNTGQNMRTPEGIGTQTQNILPARP